MSSVISRSTPFRPSARSLRTIVLALAGGLLAIELATRIDQAIHYEAPVIGDYSYDKALFEVDQFGVRGRPNGRYEKWRMNSLGLRGPEARSEREPGRLRIVALGSSETFGLYESADGEWPRVLARTLSDSGLSAEVLNGAIPGASPPVQLNQLLRRLLPLQPDIVVWLVHYPSFAGLSADRLEARMAAGPRESGDRPSARLVDLRSPRRLRDAIVPRIPTWLGDPSAAYRRIALSRLRTRMGAEFGSLEHVSTDELGALERFVAMASDPIASRGGRLVVVFPPYRNDEEAQVSQSLSFPYVAESWVLEAIDRFPGVVERSRRAPAVSVLDLRLLFDRKEKDYMTDAVHYNDEGARLIGRRVADFLAAEKVAAARSSEPPALDR